MLRENFKFNFYLALLLVISPVLLFLAARRRPAPPARAKILVVPILTRMGDLIAATPVFRAIKESYPTCRLTVIAADKSIGVVKQNQRIDELVNINKPPFRGLLGRGRLYLYLMRSRFDYGFALSSSPFGSLLLLASLAPVRVKTVFPRRSLAEFFTDWFNTELKKYRAGEYLPAHYLNLLQAINIQNAPVIKEVFVSASAREEVNQFLAKERVTADERLIGLALSAGSKRKEWPLDRFVELADVLINKFGFRVVIIDSPVNSYKADRFLKLVKEPSRVITATSFSLEVLPALVERLSLLIAVDTGPIHLAEALGVLAIDILGPETPGEMAPKNPRILVLKPPTPPIYSVTGVIGDVTRAPEAVTAITTADVLRAIDRFIKAGWLRGKD
jgi:ADP-heptose:LPS heptosyltransferase